MTDTKGFYPCAVQAIFCCFSFICSFHNDTMFSDRHLMANNLDQTAPTGATGQGLHFLQLSWNLYEAFLYGKISLCQILV